MVSRAAGRLQIQLGRKESAGGGGGGGGEGASTKLGVSFEGARAADLAVVKTTSLMEFFREM